MKVYTIATCLYLAALAAPLNLWAQSKTAHATRLAPAAMERLAFWEDSLSRLADTVVNCRDSLRRVTASQLLQSGLETALQEPNAFNYTFDKVKAVSILAPPDSSFRLFTWQLFVNDSTYQYQGLVQVNKSEPTLFPLTDRSADMDPPPLFEALPPDQWYGALYYSIRQFDTPQGRRYLLMGFDAYSFFERRKLIDVFLFDKNGQPEFGAPVFDRPQRPGSREHRMVFDYSAEASIKVNWDEEYKMVLFDHLLPVPSPYRSAMTAVPDGSYDGLRFENGRWVFVDKVFNDFQETPPFPVPVLNGRGKDILGKDVKSKKN